MANKTTNYNLTKPTEKDFYNVNDANGNMDIIDAELKKLNDGKAPSGHGLGTISPTYKENFKETLKRGNGFYTVGDANDSPNSSTNWLNLLQTVRDVKDGIETGSQLVFRDFDTTKPQMWLRTLINGSASSWVEMLHTGNISNYASAKIATGSYVGTGVGGSANPNVLEFDFEPKIVIVELESGAIDASDYGKRLVAVRGVNTTVIIGETDNKLAFSAYAHLTWEGNKFSWYVNNDTFGYKQLNVSDKIYRYIAIG